MPSLRPRNTDADRTQHHDDLVRLLGREDLLDAEDQYLRYHAGRFAYNLALLDDLLAGATPDEPVSVLEFGPHLLTRLMTNRFGPRIRLATIGHPYERMMSSEQLASHTTFDFNDAQYPDRWPSVPAADVVIFCEVLEHLYTAPSLVLAMLRELTSPGGRLVCSTPNAAAFSKRLALVRGRHPYEAIRENRREMGHIREYTEAELRGEIERAGFTIERFEVNNYWPQHAVTAAISRSRRSLAQGFTVVARR